MEDGSAMCGALSRGISGPSWRARLLFLLTPSEAGAFTRHAESVKSALLAFAVRIFSLPSASGDYRSDLMIEKKLFVSGLFALALASATHGGTFVEQFLTASPAAAADLSSGISASQTYTHLVDWGTNDGGAVVNGVTFPGTEGGVTGTNYTLTGTNNIFQDQTSNNYDPTSGMFDLTDDFLFTGSIPPAQTLTLTGLVGGRTYTISHYQSSGWNGAQQVLDGDDDGFGFNTLTTDRGDASGPKVIRYTYTQAPGDTDFQMTFTAVNAVDGFHHYAFTNELVGVPEPLSLGLVGVGALGLLSRRRRA
jgi:hypothetical protein